jgi:hypothetical protein
VIAAVISLGDRGQPAVGRGQEVPVVVEVVVVLVIAG